MSGIFGIGAGGDTGFYDFPLDQSLRFNDDDSAHLSKLWGSAGNKKTFTISMWFKRSKLGARQDLVSFAQDVPILIDSDDEIQCFIFGQTRIQTNRKFRDTSAWYHIVLEVDSTQATSSDRINFYVNGTKETDLQTETYPSQNLDANIYTSSLNMTIGRTYGGSNYFDGYMAEVNFLDGVSADVDQFGETKSGIWIPKQYTGSYGTNGFRLTFEDDTTVEGFNTVLWTGNGESSRSVQGVGFSPDLVWTKMRADQSISHQLYDTVRGAGSGKELASNGTNTEGGGNADQYGYLNSFDSDGFTGVDGTGSPNYYFNQSGKTYVAWCWDAGTGSAASNADGSITSSVKANTTRGFSIVTYTGTGSNATVGHGLGAAPDWILVKKRANDTQAWQVYHSGNTANPETDKLTLNTSAATVDDNTTWNDTAPTSTVFSIGTGSGTNESGDTYVAYCWTDISGYSKFGSYTGTGSAGKAITTGFKPAWIMIKRRDSSNNWVILDTTRDAVGDVTKYLAADTADNESDSTQVQTQIDSTGFTIQSGQDIVNASSGEYVYMAFADTREYAFWTDRSGNNNDFQHNNLEHIDVKPDRPTNNFTTLNPLLFNTSPTIQEGNLEATLTSGSGQSGRSRLGSTFHINSGKWYWELTLTGTGQYVGFGISRSGFRYMLHTDPSEGVGFASFQTQNSAAVTYYAKDGTASSAISGTGPTVTNIVQIALDADNGKMWVGNGTNFYSGDGSGDITGTSGDPAAGTNAPFTSLDFSEPWTPMIEMTGASKTQTFIMNFGQNGDFNGTEVSQGNTDSRGHGDFYYAPPTGFLALCSENLPDPAVDPSKGETPDEYFNTVTYTGTGASTLSITGVGFQPDWVWAKKRSAADSHATSDVVRGVTKTLFPDVTNAESTDANGLQSFDTDGFTIGSGSGSGVWGGNSGATYVAWNWKAGGSDSTNSVGDLTSQVSVNTEAGFSIVAYTGSDSAATVGHGLGVAPDFVLIKQRTATGNWIVGADIPNWTWTSDYLLLDDTAAKQTNAGSTFFTGAPTSTVLNLGGGSYTSSSSQELIAYCFAEIEGYSKVGTYTGNGSSDGAFVFTGFKPAWVMLKRTNTTGSWKIFDNKRPSPFNVINARLEADNNVQEDTSSTFNIDFLSNGFKLRGSSGEQNGAGSSFVYLAFAEQPFKYANAR